MKRAALAALLALAPAAAEAAWRAIPASPPGACAGDMFVFTRDGWHYACAQTGAGDALLRNGVELASLPAGALSPRGKQFGYDAAISDDARVVLHQMAAFDKQGNPVGAQIAANGRPFGKVYQEIFWLALEGGGADFAYAGKSAAGWRVITAAGEGPVLDNFPGLVGLGVTGRVAYYVMPSHGTPRLYVNHVGKAMPDTSNVTVSPDLKRHVVVISRPEQEGLTVDPGLGAKTEGPWMGVGGVAFAPDGRRYAYTARSNPATYDTVVLNGTRHACAQPRVMLGQERVYRADVVFSRFGSAAWVCSGKHDSLYFEGKRVASFSGHLQSLAFTPGGKPGVLVSKPDGTGAVVTGSGAAAGLPKPLQGAVLGFDTEDQFHYYARVDGQVVLVCGAFGDKSPALCVKRARAVYKP